MGPVGNACVGSESHCETTKSLQICYLFNINLSCQDLGRRRTETTHHQRVDRWVTRLLTVLLEWRQRLRACVRAGGGYFQHTWNKDCVMWYVRQQWRSQRGVWGFKPPPLRKLCICYCLVIEQKQWLIIKIVATRCHILRLKCTKFRFRLGLRPRPRWPALGELIALPQTL